MNKIKKLLTGVLLILGMLAVLILVLHGIDKGYNLYFGSEDIYVLSGAFSIVPFVCILVLFCIFLEMFTARDPLGINLRKIPLSKRGLLFFGAIVLAVLCIFVSALQYEKYTLQGIEIGCFGNVKEYSWQEVDTLELKADGHGVLTLHFNLKDGKHCYLNGGFFRGAEYNSPGYDEKFPEGIYDYGIYLSRTLAAEGVKLQADRNTLEKKLSYEVYKELTDEMITEYENYKGLTDEMITEYENNVLP